MAVYCMTFGIPIGLMFGFVWVRGSHKKLTLPKKILVIILVMILTGIIFGLPMFYADQKEYESWNNGYCIIDGGEMRLVSATRLRHGGSCYYWECDTCHNIIETSRNWK